MTRARTIRSTSVSLMLSGTVLAIVGIGTSLLFTFDRERRAVASSRDVVGAFRTVLDVLLDAETGQRGYLLTSRAEYLEPFLQARPRIDKSLGQLEATHLDEEQRQRMQRLRAVAERKMAELQTTIDLERGGHHAEALAHVNTDAGKRAMDEARELVDASVASERSKRDARTRYGESTFVVALVANSMAALTALVLGLVLRRIDRDLRRREDLEAELRRAADGERAARQEADSRRAQAEIADRSKDEFMAMLGHELRNPLAPILTALQLLELRAGNAFERERTIIERQVKHMVRLVDDLLDVSRITRGKIELAQAPVQISEVIAKAIEMLGPLVEERQHSVTLAVPLGLYVVGDEIRLAQVMANLIANAAKYTEKGGRIEISAERRDGDIVVAVRDNGVGIAPEMLPRVFDMFVQERQAPDRARGGLGLGLAIVRSLVVMHGGSVSAHSDGAGKGSCFTVRLPETEHAIAAADARDARPAPAAPDRGISVLVVDDNADALELLSETLEVVGYRVMRAVDGPSALVQATKQMPSIALLDIGLPVMDGYELAERLLQLEGAGDLQLVAVTGYGQENDRERSRRAGFVAHLVKPVRIEDVQATIARLAEGGYWRANG